jgi:hypothetical protein
LSVTAESGDDGKVRGQRKRGRHHQHIGLHANKLEICQHSGPALCTLIFPVFPSYPRIVQQPFSPFRTDSTDLSISGSEKSMSPPFEWTFASCTTLVCDVILVKHTGQNRRFLAQNFRLPFVRLFPFHDSIYGQTALLKTTKCKGFLQAREPPGHQCHATRC